MLFIFGWDHITTKQFGPAVPVTCPRCFNYSYWHLQESTRWFTLFFAPVIPYETSHQFYCTICSSCLRLSDAQLANSMALQRATAAYLNGSMHLDAYNQLVHTKRPKQLPWLLPRAANPEEVGQGRPGPA